MKLSVIFYKRIYKKKSISPLIATILLIVVSVALIGIILSFGKDFSVRNLDKVDIVEEFPVHNMSLKIKNVKDNLFRIENNLDIPLNIVGYTIISNIDGYDLLNTFIELENPIDVNSNQFADIKLACIPERNFKVVFKSDRGDFYSVNFNNLVSNINFCDSEYDPLLSNNFNCGDNLNYYGYDYKTTEINGVCWFAENLRYLPEVHNYGDEILIDNSSSLATEPRYYVAEYEGTDVQEAKSTVNYQKYGVYYNWNAAMNWDGLEDPQNLLGLQGICPNGWYVPTDSDFENLINWIESEGYENDQAGAVLKAENLSSPWDDGTDLYGFGAIPTGFITFYEGFLGTLNNSETSAYFITSKWELTGTGYLDGFEFINSLSFNPFSPPSFSTTPSFFGLSLRCIKSS